MPIARMQKVHIIGMERQKRHILDLLQDMGVMQVEDVSKGETQLEREINYDATLSELEFAISFLETYETKKGGFLENLASKKEHVSYSYLKEKVSKTDFKSVIKKCRQLERELTNLDDLIKNLLHEKALLESWRKLDVTLKDLKGTEKIKYFCGSITVQNLGKVKAELEGLAAALEVTASTKSGELIIVAVERGDEERVRELLYENDFTEVNLPVSNRTPREELGKIQFSLLEASLGKDNIREKAEELAALRFDLMLAHDYFLQKKTAQSTEKMISLTPYTFSVHGWIKKRYLKTLQKKLASFYPESLIISIEPDENEHPPVAIENVSAMKPFEAVTGIYGLPSYKEVDPTPLLSVFFIIFFGLCLGDAGYGITLTVVSYFFYRKLGPRSSAARLLKLLTLGGVVTFIAGAITGGWFGVEPANFPEFLEPVRDFLLGIRVIDPVKNPIGMLILSLAFGLVQILFGISIDMYIKIRDGSYLDAILDGGLWIYFLLSLVAFIVQKAGAVHLTDNLGWFVLGGAGALILTQGRKEKKLPLKIAKGVLSLYNTVGYFSDILSYSRILALGMATSIIAMVINMVAMMTKDMAPIIGYILMILVLVGGHIFNIAVNVLGSFIHSSRLQFVEFFSKFLQGGGTEFKPFKREAKYIEVKE